MKTNIRAAGPLDVLVGRLLRLKTPARIDGWKFEFSPATKGGVIRVCATIYGPTQQPPYNGETWDTKIAGIVLFRRCIASLKLKRMTPNA